MRAQRDRGSRTRRYKPRQASAELARALVGALAKEGVDELKVLREYLEMVAKGRSGQWKTFYQAARQATGT